MPPPLTPGDTFLIGGRVVRYDRLREMTVEVSREATKPPKIAVFAGTKFATSTQLSQRILDLFQQPDWPQFRWKSSALEPLLDEGRSDLQKLSGFGLLIPGKDGKREMFQSGSAPSLRMARKAS